MTGPLAGIRVLDLTRLVPGAVCSQLLGDLGAEIIKVEAPGAGDYMRAVGPPAPGGGHSYQYATLNRNKRAVSVNLRAPGGAGLLRRLAGRCDVLIENYRPGVMASIGLSYDELKGQLPDLIYCAISGFGQAAGPAPAHDINLLAMSGFLAGTGETPALPPAPLADFETGERAALAICAALAGRAQSGGAFLDIAMLDGMVSWMMLAAADYLATGREPDGHNTLRPRLPVSGGRFPGYGAYRTRDGRFVAIGAVEDRLWRRLCETVGLADLADSGVSAAAMDQELAAVIASRALADWMADFSAAGVPATPVSSVAAAVNDPVVRGRGLLRQVAAGDGTSYQVVGWGLGTAPSSAPDQSAVAPGADTAAVLAEIGITDDELAALRQEGVIA
jgi:crotonobetainyl-CoA:carnitine CoA-transferase CaiB-like acyl-CoA transferase